MQPRFPPLVAAALVGLGLSCSDQDPRPPRPADCNDAACLAARDGTATGASIGGGRGGGGNSGGSAGNEGLGTPAAGTLAGSVSVIVDTDVTGVGPLDGAIEVRSTSATGAEVSAEPAVDGSFRLEGVEPTSPLWVGTGAFDDDTTGLFMDTVQAVDGTAEEFVNLLVMRRSVMEEIAQIGFMSDPVELNPARGHAVITFVDSSGRLLPAVRVTLPGDAAARLAYDVGDIYSDLAPGTSSRGIAVVVNANASAFPGNILPVDVEVQGEVLDFNVRFARGSVTVIQVELE